VETLSNASDADLLVYLLQLVQALRYEPAEAKGGELPAAATGGSGPVPILSSTSGQPLSLLASFLIRRACSSPVVANFFYWYLKVNTENGISHT